MNRRGHDRWSGRLLAKWRRLWSLLPVAAIALGGLLAPVQATAQPTFSQSTPYTFALGIRADEANRTAATTLGAVTAANAISYQIDSITPATAGSETSGKFVLDATSGVLSFIGAATEDVTLNASYALSIQASNADGTTSATVIVLVGICDRVAVVRDAILSKASAVSCGAVTAAGLGGVTTLDVFDTTGNVTHVPDGSFAALTSLETLSIQITGLASFGNAVFDGLDSLTRLSINGGAFTTIPQPILNLSNLDTLELTGGSLTALPEAPSFSQLVTDGAFTFLRLDGNDLRQLPRRVFAGVSINSGGQLRVDVNPGADFPVNLAIERVADTGGSATFRVVSDLAGPSITVDWSASGTGDSANGSVTVGGGSLLSETFAPSIAFTTLSLSNPQIDENVYKGFDPQLPPTALTVGAPQFIPATGYVFDVASAVNGAVVGSVAATDFEGDAISYTLVGGSHSASYTINSSSRVLTYIGTSGATESTHLVTVQASDGTLASTVQVTVRYQNILPYFTATGPFSVPSRTPGQATVIGTVAATDVNQGIISYTLVSSRFVIDNNGVLSFVGTAQEDVTQNASYALSIQASNADATASATVIVLVGICDRVAVVRDAILSKASASSCETVTAAGLGGVTTLDVFDTTGNVTHVPDGSFAGLTSLETLSIQITGLASFGNAVFDGLDSLTRLSINGGAFTTIPQPILNLSNLDTLELTGGSLTTLPEAPSFARLATSDAFTFLRLDGNDLRQLPRRVFAGVSINSGGQLRVDVNPGADFPVNLAIEWVSGSGASATFRVVSDLAGPSITVDWSASGTDGNTNGSVTVGGGSDASEVFTPGISGIATVTLDSAVIDARYIGFTAQLPAAALTVGAPQFIPATGYVFDVVEAVNGAVVGSVAATDFEGGTITYSRIGGSHSASYTINSSSGVLTYIGTSGATESTHLVTVQASDGSLANAAQVTVRYQNILPYFTATGPFSVPSRTPGQATVIGTVAATDVNQGIISYDLNSSRFVIDNNGVLSFVGTAFEDVTQRAAYTLNVYALIDPNHVAQAAVEVNVGICDRSAVVFTALRSAIDAQNGSAAAALCKDVTANDLAAISGTFAVTNDSSISSFRAIDFGGLTGISALLLSGNQLSALPDGVFGGLSGLTRLDLSGNRLSALPSQVFDGLTALTSLNLSGNSAAIQVTLWIELLSTQSFRVCSDFPGPALNVEWEYKLTNGDVGQNQTGMPLSIPAGLDCSSEVTLGSGLLRSARVRSVAVNVNFSGFAFQQLVPTVAGAPLFTQPAGYQFTLSLGGEIVGSVSAANDGAAAISYTIVGGDYRDRYQINSGGQLSYSSDRSETVNHVIIVEASDGALTVTASVAIVHDLAPFITSGTFYLPPRTVAETLLIGTVTASDAEGQAITSYSLESDGSGKFSLASSTDGGALYFDGADIEDIALTAVYTLIVRATNSSEQFSLSEVTLNVGICDRIAPVRAALISAIEAQNGSAAACERVTTAQLGDLTELSITPAGGFHDLPNGSLAGLSGVERLTICQIGSVCLEGTGLRTLGDTVFDGLDSLKTLNITYGALSEVPQAVRNLTNLDNLSLAVNALPVLPETFFNAATQQTEAFSFARVGANGTFGYLNFTHNSFSTVPPRLFEGVSITGELRVDNSAGHIGSSSTDYRPFVTELAVELLPYATGSTTPQFRVNIITDGIVGPEITINWAASNGSTIQYSSATIAGGGTQSGVITPTLSSIVAFEITGVDIAPRYFGFDSMVVNPKLIIGEPVFGQPSGYVFSLDATAGATIVGTITAVSNGAVTYRISSGAQSSSYMIDANSGVLRYVSGGETLVTHVLVVEAAKDSDTTDVGVTINVDVAPAFSSAGPFYLASRSGTQAVLIGTVAASDANGGDDTVSYQLSGAASGRFSIATVGGSGELYFNAAAIEDVTLTAAYTLDLAAVMANGQTVGAAVTLNIGICDRPAVVYQAIVTALGGSATCDRVSAASLATVVELNVDANDSVSSLPQLAFAGLNNAQTLAIELSALAGFDAAVFGDLVNLKALTIGRVRGSQLTAIPAVVLALRDLETLRLGNALAALPETPVLARIAPSSGFRRLDLSANNITQLPPRAFEGVRFADGGVLDMSGNPSAASAAFTITIAPERAPDVGGSPAFRLVSDIAGPAISVDWQSSNGESGTLSIIEGSRESAAAPLSASAALTVSLSNPQIDAARYVGFTPSLSVAMLSIGAPQFAQPLGYRFDLNYATSGAFVGSVTASDFESDTITYAVAAGAFSGRYAIDGDGVLYYSGDGNETAVSQVLTITATDTSDQASTVSVAITLNVPPQFAAGAFYAPPRDANGSAAVADSTGQPVVIASDGNGDTLSYRIVRVTAATAAVGVDGTFQVDSGGALRLVSARFEDVTLNASYAVSVSVSDGVYQRGATLVVNLGICDRIVAARVAIASELLSGTTCQRVSVADLSGIDSLSLTDSSDVTTQLPDGSFAGLNNAQTLTIALPGLAAIGDAAFAGLAALRALDISDSALTAVPQEALRSLRLETLAIRDSLALLPPTPFSFASLSAAQGFTRLDFSGNNLALLPPRAFEGVALSSDGRLTVANNPAAGGTLAVALSIAPVAASGGSPTFYVASAVAGPAISVGWAASAADGAGGVTAAGNVMIAGGSRASGVFTPQLPTVATLRLTSAVVDSRYIGFAPQLPPLLTLGAPIFSEPHGYFFDFGALSGETIVGTVSASGSGTISYTLIGGAQSTRYAIDQSSGELRYIGSGSETLAQQTVIVEARNGSEAATVAVAITVNVPLVFTAVGPFYLGTRASNIAAALIGTVVARDDNGDDQVTRYTILSDTNARFSIGAASGALYFSGQGVEDLSLTAAYTLRVGAETVSGQSASAAVALNIGICDRTAQVRAALSTLSGQADCAVIDAAALRLITRLDLKQQRIAALQSFDFAALGEVGEIDLSGNVLVSLPPGLFNGLGGLQYLILEGNAVTVLPEGTFSGLGSLYELNLAELALSSLPVGLLNGLSGLRILRLNDNRFSALPAPLVQALSNSAALNLNSLYLHRNGLAGLPDSGSFAALGHDGVVINERALDGVLHTLDLSGNALSVFPAGIFGGLNVSNLLDVSDNPQPGGVALLTVAMRQLPSVSAAWQLAVSTSLRGPAFAIAYQTTTGGATASGAAAIPAGAAEVTFTVASTVARVALNTVTIGGAYRGFMLNVDNAAIAVGAPAFAQSSYRIAFDIEANNAAANLIGTVRATDLESGNSVVHRIVSGATAARYSIKQTSGELRYIAGGGETIADQVLIVEATNGQRVATVSVTVAPNTVPRFVGSDAFYVGARIRGAAALIGTLAAADADGDAISIYSLDVNPEGKFSLVDGGVSGQRALYFTNADAEDVSLSAAYTLVARVQSNRNAATAAITVNVGICDRTSLARAAILAALSQSDCARVTSAQLQAYSGTLAIAVSSTAPLERLQSFDFAALSSLSALTITGHAQLRELPSGLFDGLTGLNTLDLGNNALASLDEGLFGYLTTSLTVLILRNNGLSAWPRAVESLRALDRLDLAANRIISLPEDVRIAALASNAALTLLDLSGNDLVALPAAALSGLGIAAGGTLDLSANPSPGDVLAVGLAPLQLPNSSSFERYQVRSRLPGPIVSVSWRAFNGDGSTDATGSVTVAAGATASDIVELGIGAYRQIAFGNAVISDTRYVGFTPALTLLPLVSGQPRFSEADGYRFTGLYADSTSGSVIGTVAAIDPNNPDSAPNYLLISRSGPFLLTQQGVITYEGSEGATPGHRFDLVVRASGEPEATVAVTIHVNSPPQVFAADTFFLPLPPSSGGERALGRLSVSDPDGDALSYTIIAVTAASTAASGSSGKFSINNDGFLSFIGSALEDAAFNASYAVTVRASDNAGAVTATAIVNVGICDRTAEVREALVTAINGVSECSRVTSTQLGALSGALRFNSATFTELQPFDFAGLGKLSQLSLSSSTLQSLVNGMFTDLQNLKALRINSAELMRIEAGSFDGLANLKILELSGNSLAALPPDVFASLGQGALTTLRLDNNRLSALPPGVFAGLAVSDLLNLEVNPGAPFAATLSLQQLASVTGSTLLRFVVRNALPGPAIAVDFVASGAPSGDLAGSANVAGGSTASSIIAISDNHNAIRITSATIDSTRYMGFAATFSNTALTINVPVFERDSYDFTLSRGLTSSATLAIYAENPGNPDDRVRYTLIGAGSDRFTVTQVSNQDVFSYSGSGETSGFTLTVVAESRGVNGAATISVRVENDHAPQFIGNIAGARNYTFNFEANLGEVVVDTVSATDGNGESPTYAFVGDSGAGFSIDQATGVVYRGAAGARQGSTFSLRVRASDAGGNSSEATIEATAIGLEFVDATGAVFVGAPRYTFTIERGLPASDAAVVALGTVYASDSDNRSVVFSVVAGQGGDRFSLATSNLGDGGATIANGVLHYSGSGELATSDITLRVMTTDAASATRSHQATARIELRSNTAPEFDRETFQFALSANDNRSNIIIGTVSASDRNQETLSYSIHAGGDPRFSIEADSGVLHYERSGELSIAVISLIVRVTDVSAAALSDTAAVAIDISNLAFVDAALNGVTEYAFTLSQGASGASEALAIGTVQAQDSEGGTIAYFLSNSAGGLFGFGQSGAFGIAIAYLGAGETSDQTLEVQAITQSRTTTSGVFVAGRTISATVRIEVVNDQPPQFVETAYTFGLNARNSGVSMAVFIGVLTATDANLETVTFSLDTASSSVVSRFSINTVNGMLYYIGGGESPAAVLPPFRVLATDANGNTAAATVAVTIVAVRFDQPSYNFTLMRGHTASGGIPLGTISATDSEGETLTYSLSGDGIERFSLSDVAGGGVALRYISGNGATESIALEVRVASPGGARSAAAVVAITVENTIAPVFIGAPYTFTMNAGVSGQAQAITLGNVMASDGNFETPLYRIDGDNRFSIDTSGVLRYVGSGERYAETPAMVVVSASDASNNTVAATVAVVLIGLRFEPPPESPSVPYGLPWSAPVYTFDLFRGVPFNERTDTQGNIIAFGTVQATDSDGDPIAYRIDAIAYQANNHQPPANLFILGSANGALSYNSTRGETQNIMLTVSASAAELSATAAVLIRVVNNAGPKFIGAPYTFNVAARASGTPNSFVIGEVLATDANRDTITYFVDGGSEGFDERFEFSNGNRVLNYIGNGETPNAAFSIAVTACDQVLRTVNAALECDSAGNSASEVIYIRVGPTTMTTRTEVTDMTVAQVARSIVINTVDVLGGRFNAAPHLIISGNALQAEWQRMRRLGRWSALQNWQQASAWDGVERELGETWLKGRLGLDFVDGLSAKWTKFRANLVTGSSFLMRLAAVGEDADGEALDGSDFGYGGKGGWSFWGKGHVSGYQRREGANTVKGRVLSGYLGIDYELRDMFSPGDRLLLGIAVARSGSSGEFSNSADQGLNADVDTSINSVFPYVQWGLGNGFELWGMFGGGIGTAEVSTVDASYPNYKTDLSLLTFGGGVKQVLLVRDRAIGSSEMSLKADAFVVNVETDAVDTTVRATEASSHRLRFALQDSRRWEISDNVTYSGELELGGRMDGGDGADGYGLDVGVGFGYDNQKSGITFNSQGRWLLLHTQDSREWGLDVTLRVRPKAFSRARGFTLTFAPGWGQAATRIDALWQHGASASLGSDNGAAAVKRGLVPDRAKLSASYGLQYHRALLQPFVEMGMQQDDVTALKIGLKAALSGMAIAITADRQRAVDVGWRYGW